MITPLTSLFDDPWAGAYGAQALVVAIALGIAFFGMPRTLGGNGAARFALGVAVYPSYVALSTTVLVVLLPGAAAWVFIIVPIAGAILAASVTSRRFPGHLRRRIGRALRSHPFAGPAGLAVALILLATAGIKLGVNASHPLVEHDSLVYAQEAIQLAASRAGADLARPTTEANVVAGHPHTAIYQAYLAHALLFGTDVHERIPADLPARIAVQATIVAMFMAVVSLGCLTRVAGAAPLALALTLIVADFGYLSVASSRDGLRIGSFLVFCYLLVQTLRAPRRIRLSTGIALALALGVAAAAHTLNVIAVALASAAWATVAALRRYPARRTAVAASWAVAGLAAPGAHYLVTFAESGRAFGHGFYYYAYAGTPLWDAWTRSQSIAESNAMGIVARFAAVAQRGNTALFVAGVAAAVWLGWFALRRRNRESALRAFIAVLTLLMLVPLTGILDFSGNTLAAMHVANFRYFLVWYPLAALAIVGLLASIRKRRPGSAILILALGFTGVLSAKTIQHWSVQQADNIERYGIAAISAAVAAQPDVGRVWIDHVGLRYYLRSPTLFAYQPPGSEVLRAATPEDAAQTLQKLGVTHFVLTEPIKDWWGETALYRLASADDRLLLKSGLHALYRIAPHASIMRKPSSGEAASAQ